MEPNHQHRELVELCKRNDPKAQFDLYRLYSKAMYNICLRMLNDAQFAEDILQHSFLDVFSKLDSFRQDASIGAWIKRITINNCINFLKKKRLEFTELQDFHTGLDDTDHQYSEPALNVATIQKAIYQLPEGYRVVFLI